ncbi:hypothetical protein NA63_2751 [Flavobacteriaceae bacterium MAR_2010_105]|nr:hypothetical protein NA63_2751 [Flavobacteriaceae bacterium MAR_2010_105]
MIKFFRKIRYNLMEQNKTSKYFKYAIGEIVLVVIGILIALQINNWNINRTNGILEQQYINRLIKELKNDLNTYTNLKNGFSEQQKSINDLLEIINQPNPVIQDSSVFWNKFFAASGVGPWYKEPVIWTQLVQSGELTLIKDQNAIETLFSHYSNVKSVADNFNEYPTQTTTEARKLIATTLSESSYITVFGEDRSKWPDHNVFRKILDKKNEYQALFVRIAIISRVHVSQMINLTESTQNAITILESNLK